MQEQGIINVVFLIFQIVVVLQINLKIRIGYNFFTNKGVFLVQVFGWKIFHSRFSFEKGYIFVVRKNGKKVLIPMSFEDPKTIELADFPSLLIRKLYLKRLNLYFNFGSKENAFATSMCVGAVRALSNGIGAYVKTKKESTIITNKIYPVYNKDYLKVNFKVSASISLFDLFWCFGEYQFKKVGNKK